MTILCPSCGQQMPALCLHELAAVLHIQASFSTWMDTVFECLPATVCSQLASTLTSLCPAPAGKLFLEPWGHH